MLQAIYLQCSAMHLQLGGGGKFLSSLACAQSLAVFRNSQHPTYNLCTFVTRTCVLFDFWWLFRKLLVHLQRYLHQWESVLHAGKLSFYFPAVLTERREFDSLRKTFLNSMKEKKICLGTLLQLFFFLLPSFFAHNFIRYFVWGGEK